jgi:hypothetical protein
VQTELQVHFGLYSDELADAGADVGAPAPAPAADATASTPSRLKVK